MLKEFIKKNNMTIEGFCSEYGLSRSTMYRIFQGYPACKSISDTIRKFTKGKVKIPIIKIGRPFSKNGAPSRHCPQYIKTYNLWYRLIKALTENTKQYRIHPKWESWSCFRKEMGLLPEGFKGIGIKNGCMVYCKKNCFYVKDGRNRSYQRKR
ncbi:MAG: hypothetical protein KGI50_05485 [Patescibacteria group bacterium]|nr:hypothetical protein [Patescibacteria group bacterium]MDE2438742.1 hypothetical protein [Patescibacteria group bacterium]